MEDGLLIKRFWKEQVLSGDNVIICVGSKPENSLIKALEKKVEFVAIGDCVAPRYIMDAVHDGFIAGINA